MSGSWSNHLARKSSTRLLKRRVSTSRELAMEPLELRTVLSAMPLAEMAVMSEPVQVAEGSRSEVIAEPLVANSAPSGTDGMAFMQGNVYTFSIDDFGFLDPGDTPPDLLAGVRIASLPARGQLTAVGAGVAVGQVISAQTILQGDFRFTTSGVEDLPYASLTFQVQDDGGTLEGGSDLDPTPNTFTIFFDDPEVDFVQNLYRDILEREAESGGLVNWLDRLDTGISRQQIASELWGTFEHRAIQVDGYYDTFLDRDPDPAGRNFWINRMLGGMSESSVMAAFMTTEEFMLNNSTNQELLTAYYQDLFDRAPDTNGQTFWLNQLTSGQMTRAEVAEALVGTRERYLGLVFDYYDEFYGRLPDSQGLEFWVNQLDQNLLSDRGVAEALFATEEYFNLPL